MLGQYVTDHPLLAVKDHLARVTSMEIVELSGPEVGDGDIADARRDRRVASAASSPSAASSTRSFRLEDLTGGVGVVVFPSLFEQTAGLIAPDRIVLVKGRVDLRGRELQLVALEITEPDLRSISGGGPVVRIPESTEPFVVDIPVQVCTETLIRRLKDLLGSCAGSRPVTLCLVDEHGSQRLRLGEEFSVDGSAALLSELRHLLGPGAVRDARARPGPRVVAFEVIPAIDLQGGRVARMTRGDRASIRQLDLDPLRLVAEWRDAGARWVHVVDLDAALDRRGREHRDARAVAALGVRVEAGGGLSEEGVGDALGRGADAGGAGRGGVPPARASSNASWRGTASGWPSGSTSGAAGSRRGGPGASARRSARRSSAPRRPGPALLVYTDADRDGALAGPDLEGLAAAATRQGSRCSPRAACGPPPTSPRWPGCSRPWPASSSGGPSRTGCSRSREALAAASID